MAVTMIAFDPTAHTRDTMIENKHMYLQQSIFLGFEIVPIATYRYIVYIFTIERQV